MAYFPVTCPRTGDTLYVDVSVTIEDDRFTAIDVNDAVYEDEFIKTLQGQLDGHTFFDFKHFANTLISMFGVSDRICPELFEMLCPGALKSCSSGVTV